MVKKKRTFKFRNCPHFYQEFEEHWKIYLTSNTSVSWMLTLITIQYQNKKIKMENNLMKYWLRFNILEYYLHIINNPSFLLISWSPSKSLFALFKTELFKVLLYFRLTYLSANIKDRLAALGVLIRLYSFILTIATISTMISLITAFSFIF